MTSKQLDEAMRAKDLAKFMFTSIENDVKPDIIGISDSQFVAIVGHEPLNPPPLQFYGMHTLAGCLAWLEENQIETAAHALKIVGSDRWHDFERRHAARGETAAQDR